MRIGIFSECYLPTNNGVVASIETFRKEMEKRGHEYFIFAPETEGYDDTESKDGGPAHVFRFPAFIWPSQKNYPVAWPINFRELSHQVERLNLDIIHSQHLFNLGRVGLKIGQKLDIPVVYTYHTLIAEYTHYVPVFGKLTKNVIIKISRDFCNACDQVVTPSPSMQKILKSYGVKQNIQAIPTGVNLEALQKPFSQEHLRRMWQIPENTYLLLYVSRVAKEKNIGFLLKAFQHLLKLRQNNESRPDVHLLMVGGGPELTYFKNLVKEWNLESAITFTDMVKPELTKKYFGAADLFVFPSITETQGIVVTEAQAAGLPVVAVNKMGPSDIVNDNKDGYLTDLNIHQFAVKINKLLNDRELRHKMSQAARKNAEQYSSKSCAMKMEKLYDETITKYKQTNRHCSQPKTS